ncbi:MAG: HPr family phosphocarrier protein [Defluviitaleaceae bacterium]|nr:HPr family phosphocarrier protein [Defluviitaleaceae bacterium]MCL2275834.1 HPr family phosphocarrier protein [Defluviitaleaceae bacterium]
MTKVMVRLDTIDKVKNLVAIVSPIDGDFDLVSDRYVVDAKSIMGIFSLDISKPLELHIHNVASAEKVMPLIEPYKV